ncbi:MAG: (2Fe-2S)-binding protein [Rhodospirillaceae bacterium]|nr:(2Fe-2S)-binding protein [Rhodospirillaceae bacterium]
MMTSAPLSLSVNGQTRQVQAGLTDTLLTVLRDQLLLTAAKRGCNQGVCGACTVMIDGKPQRACLTLAANCEGAQITTVEGLRRDPAMNRLQRAFEATGAVQCGFCTAGMLVSAHWLIEQGAAADPDRIRAGLSGNLCRCTGYRKIIDAVAQAAEASA